MLTCCWARRIRPTALLTVPLRAASGGSTPSRRRRRVRTSQVKRTDGERIYYNDLPHFEGVSVPQWGTDRETEAAGSSWAVGKTAESTESASMANDGWGETGSSSGAAAESSWDEKAGEGTSPEASAWEQVDQEADGQANKEGDETAWTAEETSRHGAPAWEDGVYQPPVEDDDYLMARDSRDFSIRDMVSTPPGNPLTLPERHPASRHRTTFLPNHFLPRQRAALDKLLRVAGISGGRWGDFVLVNHLTSRDWTLQTHQYTFHGESVLQETFHAAFLEYTVRHKLDWVQHCAPVTFEISEASVHPQSPWEGGTFGLPNFDPSRQHEPEVSPMLSSLHVRQLAAVLFNDVNLQITATDFGIHALQDADALPLLSTFSPGEQKNPSLIVKPRFLLERELRPSITNTNLAPHANLSPLSSKLLSLIGAVVMERGYEEAQTVCRLVLRLDDQDDILKAGIAALDRQVWSTTPSAVAKAILQKMGVEVEWKTDVQAAPKKTKLSPPSDTYLGSMSDTTEAERKAFHEKTEKLAALQGSLDHYQTAQSKLAKEETEEEPQGETERSDADEEGEDKDYTAASDVDPITKDPSEMTVEDHLALLEREQEETRKAVAPVEEDDPSEYALQFDANGKPVDIRQTSLTYPIEPGPYQSSQPISQAPMYYPPPAGGEPVVARLKWKQMIREEKKKGKEQLESLFQSLLTPKALTVTSVMVDQRTKQILGVGVGRSIASARVNAHVNFIQRLRTNLKKLQREAQDVPSKEKKEESAGA